MSLLRWLLKNIAGTIGGNDRGWESNQRHVDGSRLTPPILPELSFVWLWLSEPDMASNRFLNSELCDLTILSGKKKNKESASLSSLRHEQFRQHHQHHLTSSSHAPSLSSRSLSSATISQHNLHHHHRQERISLFAMTMIFNRPPSTAAMLPPKNYSSHHSCSRPRFALCF